MPCRPLDSLPEFSDDLEIGRALLGAKRAREFKQIAPLLERRGLPKIDLLFGGRYVPAVRAFFDREYGLDGAQPFAPDGMENLGASRKGKVRRSQR
jgi:hypothetical protein